jgi:predicted outer membrane repeat protein
MQRYFLISAILASGIASTSRAADRLVPSQYQTIQEAHDASQDGDTIRIESGVYPGGVEVTRSVSLIGPLEGATTCQIGRVIINADNVAIRNVRFEGNVAPQSVQAGGAIIAHRSGLTIEGCRFRGNNARSLGGAIYIAGGLTSISDCVFESNSTIEPAFSYPYGGGALAVGGGPVTVQRCLFVGNSAGPGTGGAINARGFRGGSFSYGQVTIVASVFCGNVAERGGSALNASAGPGCVFRNCSGGGLALVTGSVSPHSVSLGCQLGSAAYCSSDGVAGCDASPPAECASGLDCDGNMAIDVFEIFSGTANDCDNNFVIDVCELVSGSSADCNSNELPDVCDLASGYSVDANGNGRPDECDPMTCADADLFRDFNVNGADLGILLSQWGPASASTVSDLNRDGQVDGADLGYLLANWGACTN